MNIIFWTGVFELSTHYRAIGAYQLASWMRKHGYSCQVIDFVHHMSVDELIKFTEKFITSDTICIGISSTFWSQLVPRNKTWSMSRFSPITVPDIIESALLELRKKYPTVKWVLGGVSADFIPPESYQLFDVSIVGDAEDTFLDLVNSWKNQKRIFHSVTRGGRPFMNAQPNRIFDIQHSTHRFLQQDCIVPGETLPIEISRGCIFRCAFCQYPHLGKTKFDYLRQPELIGEEIEYNYQQFKTQNYYILDDTFNDSDYKMQGWQTSLSKLNFTINYTAYLRADLLNRNPDHIHLLQNTGLVSGFFGIESFNPEASRIVGKGWSGKQAQKFLPELKSLWKDNTTFHCSFIVGLPPETVNEYFAAQQWLIDNNIDSWVFKPLLITPGTRTMSSDFDRNYEKYGFVYDPGTQGWSSQYLNSKKAVTIAATLNKISEKYIKTTSWKALSLMGLGVDKSQLLNKKANELDWNDIHKKKQDFIATYKEKLNAL
jgi:radical SAM superfamily enzyme YgiQ (UPF0313 family)